jgi:hypothetical protein
MKTFSSQPYYSEIDLRVEFKNILYGNGTMPPKGRWIIYRQSQLANRSEWWNEETKESIGGPPFEYYDYLIRARKSSLTSGADEEVQEVIAKIDKPIVVFYLDYRMNPKKEDYILTIKEKEGPTAPSTFTVDGLYDILLVQDCEDQFARTEYFKCYCIKTISHGDSTLDNIEIKETL